MKLLIAICVFSILPIAASTRAVERKDDRYDFQTTAAYAALTDSEREKLARVRRDFATLWSALDMYAARTTAGPPRRWRIWCRYACRNSRATPSPTEQSAGAQVTYAQQSLDGWGYHYRSGSAPNRAWCVSSVGLPEFPFFAAAGNVGLYVCKGEWISGTNPVIVK